MRPLPSNDEVAPDVAPIIEISLLHQLEGVRDVTKLVERILSDAEVMDVVRHVVR